MGRQYRGGKNPKLVVYKAKPSRSEGRQITFPDSIHFIVEAMTPGNDIFDKTGEIPDSRAWNYDGINVELFSVQYV